MAFGTDAREFVLKIVADVKDATKGMETVEKSSTTMKDKVTGIGKAVVTGLAVGAVVNFGKESVAAAADAQQAMNGVRAVFGDSADEVEAFSTKAIKSMGISDDAYQAFATTTGGLLQDMGVPLDQTVKMTDDLAQRGADLASVYGVDTEQAFSAVQKAMGGSYKSLKALGIQLDSNEVKARAVSEGWVDADGNVTAAGKAMATQALIMEKSGDKAGAFAEHSGEVANQQKILALQFEETQETIGTALLPVIQKLLDIFVPLLEFTAKYADIIVPIAGVIAGIVLAYKAYEMAMMASKAAMAIATAAQWAFNAAMAANPIGLVVIAITAVIGAIVLLYMKVGWFRKAVDAAIDGVVAAFNWLKDIVIGVFNWVKQHWPLLLAIITGPFGTAVYLIKTHWNSIVAAVKWAWDQIKWLMGQVENIITWPFKQAWTAVKWIADQFTAVWKGFKDGLSYVFQQVADVITYPFKIAWDTVKWIRDNFIAGWKWFLDSLRWIFDQVYDIITWPFKQAMEAIKWLWNTTVGGFGFEIPSWVPLVGGKSFSIPEMAKGGIVRSPTVALLGEAGPEAVVPLGGAGFGNVTIQVYALTPTAEVGRKVYDALREYERLTGKVA